MKHKFLALYVMMLITLFAHTTLVAQQTERKVAPNLYLISAKAGGVNYVSGKVLVERNGKLRGFLQKGDEVVTGERISTETDGRAEVLLNPGSYIRLAGNSSFEFLSTDLDDLQVQVNKGSAIFEVIADKDFTVTVKMPNAKFYLISAGVFRVDVLENREGRIAVWKGKAQVGDISATVVKGGRTARQNGTAVAVEKFDRDNKSDFDNWSRERAKEIAQTNAKLIQNQMRSSLLDSFNNNAWSAANGYGLWVQDLSSRSYCFLPFGWGWSSPYGFGFNRNIWSYNPPLVMVAPIYQNPVLANPTTTTFNPPPSFTPSNGSGGNPANGPNGSTPSNPVTSSGPTIPGVPQHDGRLDAVKSGTSERPNSPIDH